MTTPQLTLSLNNPDAPDTVYVSSDPAANQLTLVLETNVDISLTAGDMVPIDQAAGGSGSLFYLDLSNFQLTADALSAIAVATEGWTYTPYPDDQMLGFCPTAALEVSASGTVSLSITGLVLATQPSTPTVQLGVDYFRVTGVTTGNAYKVTNFAVAVTPPPDTHDKNLQEAIVAALTPAQVVNCPISGPQLANNLSLTLSPGSKPATITAVEGTCFSLTFIYATDPNGFGALTTPAQVQTASGFSVTAGLGVSGWTITPDLSAQTPCWTLTPPVGQPILGTGAQSTLSFNLTGLVTNLQPGPTVVLLSYDNVPGYQSGTYSILVEKVPHVEIASFQVTPQTSTLTDGVASVDLSWTVTDATQLTLQPYGDVTGKTRFTATISETTQFTLIAEGQRPGNIDNSAVASCTASVLPVINSFTANPAAVYQDDFSASVALAWNVDTAGQVNLTSSLTGPDSNSYNPVGSVTKSLTGPQMLTLTPVDASGFTNVSRSIIVPAFSPSSASFNNNLTGAGVTAPVNAPFVAMASPTTNSVAILSVATFQPLATVPVGAHPLGLAFSPDGATLYVANSGAGTVSVISVTNTNSDNGYAFAVTRTVQVGGAPQHIAVGVDGSAWVTIDNGSANGSLAKITNGAVVAALDVGVNPRGVAVMPSNGMVFVANAGSGSVSVVGNGSTPIVRQPLTGLSKPLDVAISPDGSTLLVADGGASSVISVSTTYYATAPRKTFTLPDAPSVIAAFPDGQYVALGGASSTILLNYVSGTTTATPLSAAAQGVCVTPDNGMAVVSTSSPGVTVVSYAQYSQVGSPVSFSGSVTNAAVTPDAAHALVWANAGVTVQGAPPAVTGVEVYAVNTGVSAPILSGKAVSDLVVSPGVSDDALYLAEFKQSSIGLYQTSTGDLISTIPLPTKTGVTSRSAVQLAISADGTRLFALTNDGRNTFSVVAFNVNLASRAFTAVADVTAFVCQYTPLNLCLAAAPDGSAAYTVDPIGGVIYAVEQSGQTYALSNTPLSFPSYSAPFDLTVLPDGSALYAFATNGNSNLVYTIALPAFTGALTYLPDGTNNMSLSAVTASPDSSRLLAADTLFAGIRVLDAASLRIIQTLSWQSGVSMPYGVAVSPDGSRIFSANARSTNMAIAEQVQPA